MIIEGAFLEKAISELIRGGSVFFRSKKAKAVLSEALLREIRFNAAMVYEAKKTSGQNQLGFYAPIFLRKMRTAATEVIFTSGFPLSELIKGAWSTPQSANKFSSYLQGCDSNTELLEKMLHRVFVLRTLAEENLLGDNIKLDYAIFLLLESERIMNESLQR